MPRPYILGINNGQSSDPNYVFFPHDKNAAGYRLWAMVNEVMPIEIDTWLAGTQRVNLLSDTILPRDYRSAARRRGVFLHGMIRDRIVVLVGLDVTTAMQHEQEPFVWGGPSGKWISIPHPSGKNLFFNNPVNRIAAGLLLADVWRLCHGEAQGAGAARSEPVD